MDIVESWQDHHLNPYAIVRYTPEVQHRCDCKEFEVLWGDEDGQLASFAGYPGWRIADFDTLEQARQFLLTGITQIDHNPDIWFEMLEIQTCNKERR